MKRHRPKKRARILIVDDHPAVREALASRIGRQADLEVCGEAADMSEAFRLVANTQPDLAVVDISLKTGSGIDLIKRIKDRNDHVFMLVWSMHSESLYAERALRAGALGYINKDQATDKIIEAIRRVLEGKVYLSDAMAEKMLHRAVLADQTEDFQLAIGQRVEWRARDFFPVPAGRLDRSLYKSGRLDRTLPSHELRQCAYLNEVANCAPEEGFGDYIRHELERRRHDR